MLSKEIPAPGVIGYNPAVMKHLFSILMIAALCACTYKTEPQPDTKKVSFSIELEVPDTRVVISDSGSGPASFSWEDGDEIGVVVSGRYYRFTLSGFAGGTTGTFTAELPEGASIEDGAPVAFPYVAEDYNESTGTFSLAYPTVYRSSKAGDFRHRWAGVINREGDGRYVARFSHQAAILRITYENVPSGATAVQLTADRNIAGDSKTVTTEFSWHASSMDFYFPVPAGTYNSFSVRLLNGSEPVAESQKALANAPMTLETGAIYRTPCISLAGNRILVAYFSFTNTTKAIAESMADVLGADLFAITPSEAYTSDNNNYYDSSTRAYKEQYGPASVRPGIEATLGSTAYETVLLGFPIWYGKVPRVILSFLDAYDFSGKTVIPFCTSGSSGISAAESELRGTYGAINWKSGARLNGYTRDQLKTWLTDNGLMNNSTQIRLTVGSTVFSADLAGNATAEAFGALLPMTLDMSELNGNEKYHYLSSSLPTDASCPGTIHAGDILLYGNNCVVVFYKTFNTGYSYTRIGKITDPEGLESALGSGSVSVRFSR